MGPAEDRTECWEQYTLKAQFQVPPLFQGGCWEEDVETSEGDGEGGRPSQQGDQPHAEESGVTVKQ